MKKLLAIVSILFFIPSVFAQTNTIDELLGFFDWYIVEEDLDFYIGNRELGGLFGPNYSSIKNHIQYFVEEMDDENVQLDKPISFMTWQKDSHTKEYINISIVYFEPETLNNINLEEVKSYEINYLDLADAYIISEKIIEELDLTNSTNLSNLDNSISEYIENYHETVVTEQNYKAASLGEEMVEYNNVFEEKAHNLFGENLRNIEVNETEYGTGIVISFKEDQGLTYGFMKSSVLRRMSDYMNAIQGETIESLQMTALAEATDDYGNVSEEQMAYLLMYGSTIDKINFDNFDYEKIPNIADSFYMAE